MSTLVYQKVGVFIDAENIELSGYNIHGGRVNYVRLIDEIGHREITRIIYYKPIHKNISDEFRKFWVNLGGEIKQPIKNADAWLTIDAVTLADKMDVAVLVAGDKDYLPLLWYLKNRGCKVEVWSFPETCADLMKDAADRFVSMDDVFVLKDKPAPRPQRQRPRKDRPPLRAIPRQVQEPFQSLEEHHERRRRRGLSRCRRKGFPPAPGFLARAKELAPDLILSADLTR